MSNSKLNARVIGKLIYSGELELLSPLLIGTGEKEEEADIIVLKDDAGYPFIPATSMVGVMRHYCEKHCPGESKASPSYENLWGSPREKHEDSKQSALALRDMEILEKDLDRFSIRIRDGIAIDNSTGIAEDKKKFEYEVLEPGISFKFYMEITLREAFDDQEISDLADFTIQALKEGNITLGSKTTRGLGRCRLKGIHYRKYLFSNKQDVREWLNGNWELEKWEPSATPNILAKETNNLVIEAVFSIKHSLLVRSYTGDPKAPDAVHIKSGDKPVLPGTSLAGAIRARAERIAYTVTAQEKCGNDILKPLFGWADDQGENRSKGKSRIIIEEKPVKAEKIAEEMQTRIKIDRFTGGTLKAHLFEEMPLWAKDSSEMVSVVIKVENCRDYEAGLLMLVLKDLWNGDLPLGGGKNIGRGVLQGIMATVCINKEIVTISNISGNEDLAENGDKQNLIIKTENLDIDAKQFLQEKVKAFIDKCDESKEVSGNES